MTTFEQINQIMLQNGWERIIKIKDYEKLKRENKEVTARIGWSYFKLKQDKDLEAKMWKEKYENAVKTMGEIMQNLEEVKQSLDRLGGKKNV
jgi:hypothetical protein